jgi:nifR3 family TIM-barrel protein
VDFLQHPTLLAPMEGVGHPSFRRMIGEQGGVGMLCTEFVRIHGERLGRRYLESQVVRFEGVPLSVQVMGRDEELMAEAAEIVESAGADVVDINLGCPTSFAARGGVGAAMLKDLDLLSRVLGAMREKVQGRLSAKIRAGFDDDHRALDIARVVEDAGCDFLTVHPRKRTDQYRGVADWRIIRAIKDHVGIPVVGNGDAWYASDFQRMRDETGCDAVMVGRPAIRNPWLMQQAADLAAGREPFAPSGADVVAWLEHATSRNREVWSRPQTIMGRLKELVRWIGRAVDDDRTFMREALYLHTADEILDFARARLAEMPAERIDLQATPTIGLETSGSVELEAPSERAA